MKLYATVTSEKGKPANKGGQEYLEIELNGTRPYKDKLFYMRVVPDNYGHATIKNIEGSISFLRAMIDYCNYSIAVQLNKKAKGECSGKHESIQAILNCKDCAAFLDKMPGTFERQ